MTLVPKLSPNRGLEKSAISILLAAISMTWAGVSGQNLRSSEFMSEARAGFEGIYNLDYGEARKSLLRVRERFPLHPAPPLYLAVITWLEELFEREELDLDRFIAPGYFSRKSHRRMKPEDRKLFFDYMSESQEKCETILRNNPGNKDARYLLGSTYGILGSFSITIDRSVKKAFGYGKKAYRFHRDLVREDPEYFDSYMSVGTYEYIVANLPWYAKWLAAIMGYRGSEERAFEYLELAADKGLYVRNDALTLQMVLFIREKRYDDALENARRLHRSFPRNYLLHLNQAQILEMMGRRQESVRVYLDVVSGAESGRPNYQKLDLESFRFKLGVKFEQMEFFNEALRQFTYLVESDGVRERVRIQSHLRIGQILDSQNRRQEAVSHYETVLEAAPQGNSHRLARRFLERDLRRQ